MESYENMQRGKNDNGERGRRLLWQIVIEPRLLRKSQRFEGATRFEPMTSCPRVVSGDFRPDPRPLFWPRLVRPILAATPSGLARERSDDGSDDTVATISLTVSTANRADITKHRYANVQYRV